MDCVEIWTCKQHYPELTPKHSHHCSFHICLPFRVQSKQWAPEGVHPTSGVTSSQHINSRSSIVRCKAKSDISRSTIRPQRHFQLSRDEVTDLVRSCLASVTTSENQEHRIVTGLLIIWDVSICKTSSTFLS